MKCRQMKKLIAGAVTVLMLPQILVAAPPKPTIDETLYVNLDHYGAIELANVVKTYTMNGHQEIIDKGEYSKVTNMTDLSNPVLTDAGVTWQFNQVPNRFYFEGTMKAVELPFLFDVSYELNGVPVKAEDLAGASGYVEIFIDVQPNPNASEYYRNNMLLQVAATFNMDKNLSLEAPGAQIQTMGSSKMVMFVGMPGETKTFKIGIGTESFESGGISMMMVPATMEQFEMISKMRGQFPVIEQAAGAMNESMDILLGSMAGLENTLDHTKAGLEAIYEGFDQTKDKMPGIQENHTQLMEHLKTLLATMDTALPQFEIAQELINDVYAHGNEMLGIIADTKRDLERLGEAIRTIEDTLHALEEMMEDMGNVEGEMPSYQDLIEGIKRLEDQMLQVQNQFYSLGSSIQSFQSLIEKLEGLLGGNGLSQINWILGDASQLLNGLGQLIGELDTGTNGIGKVLERLHEYSKILKDYKDEGKEGFEAIKRIVNEMGDLLSDVLDFQEELLSVQETMNKYQAPIQTFLTTLQALATNIRDILDTGISQIENVEQILVEDGPTMSQGMQDALEGMIETLDAAKGSFGQLATIKESKDTVAGIIANGWNHLTQDTTLLKVDPNAPIQSITSQENQAPETLQIVVRTKEILKSDPQEAKPTEAVEKEPLSLWERIVNVCRTLWENVKALINKVFG